MYFALHTKIFQHIVEYLHILKKISSSLNKSFRESNAKQLDAIQQMEK